MHRSLYAFAAILAVTCGACVHLTAGVTPPAAPFVAIGTTQTCLESSRAVTTAPSLRDVDPERIVLANELADLPVAGLASRTISETTTYRTPDDYLAGSHVLNPDARRAAFDRAGFRGGEYVGFRSSDDFYDAIVLRFASADQTLAYFQVHAHDVCQDATVSMRPAHSAGIAFMDTDGVAHATFVVGDTEVSLHVCSCVEDTDRLGLVSRWADAVTAQLSA
ncbi:MAG TPA: hypothetical protein VHD87_14430 [Acidimicrobiales bacterium]|nr:hypothetical protein [Acidimicrobiales bacterium]